MTYFSSLRRAALFALLVAAFANFNLTTARADDAKPFLHPLFTDNMVLQRGIADPVWGWTTPGQTVTVSMGGKTAKAVAGADGKWMAKIGPFTAGGPYTLTVTGPQTATLSNVMVGDVWICSGQSNMEFGLHKTINGPAEVAAANYPNIRLFLVPHATDSSPRETVQVNATDGHWKVCTPQTAGEGGWDGFTAVGYFFGRELQQSQHVPIGLIESDWGGTIAEAWTSAEALKTMPDFQPAVTALQQTVADMKNGSSYEAAVVAWYAKHDPGSANGLGWADPTLDVSAWKTMSLPQFFQDAGDPSLAGVNGVVWFRRTFDLPAGDAGKDAVLHLLVDDNDTTWVNGKQVGATEGYNTSRAYKVPADLLKPTGNVVAVRVLDTGGKGGIYGDAAGLNLEVPGGAPAPLSGAWSYQLGTKLPADPAPALQGNNPNVVTVLYNGMIAPLVPFGVKGAIWYQGEANAGRAKQYETLLPTMIQDWRSRFGVGPFPFLLVQLAGWQPGDSWPDLRQAQWLTAKNVPNAGIATALDVGDQSDIHPTNKQEVGRRLALVAEAKVYGEKVEYYGPVYKSLKVEGGAMRLSFDHLGGGLVAKDGKPLTAFEVAGADGKFVPADAKIDGDTVVVSSAQVPSPTVARYGWSAFPAMSLYSKAGLPAFPFRTSEPVPFRDSALPANAGPNLALGKPYVCSDPNLYNYGIGGLTDGSWDSNPPHCFASGDKDAFPKTVTIDLQHAAPVGLVDVGVPPFGSTKTVQVSVSADGAAFTPVGSAVFSQKTEEKHLFAFPPVSARFVRLTYPDHYDAQVNYANTFAFTTECEVYAPAK